MTLLAVVGCGGDKDKPKYYIPKGGDAGPNEEKDANVPPEDAGPSDGPELSFVMPARATDPNDDTVITSPLVTVHCRAKQRSGKPMVDPTSVAIKLEKVDADAKEEVVPATTKFADDEYQAKFDVSGRPNGALKFTCTAKDMASKPSASTATLQTMLDLGPKLELVEPKDEGIYALRTPIVVKFKVTPQPISDGDKESDVKSVKLLVSGMEHEAPESEDEPGTYQTSVDFNDKTLFMVPPSSAEILVSASNGRTPEAATRSVKADVKVDGDGPTIQIESPKDGQIVHGEVVLKLIVQDVSGVKAGSVYATINGDALKITEWDVMGNSYQHTFDTRTFGYDKAQLTINVVATDIVGNQTSPAANFTLKLDNLPPVVSLDPPPMREFKKNGTAKFCSRLFDPVGDKAQDDLSTADVASYYRAMVEDRTNIDSGSDVRYHAGVDKNKVILYAQVDPSVPLLIDTNSDGVCDEVDYTDLPESKRPTLLKLTALDPRGNAFYPNPAGLAVDYSGSYCTGDPASTNMFPDPLCPLTEMHRVIPGLIEDKPPAIYAYMPTNGGTGECEGIAWSVLYTVHEGWRCIAARAEDAIGNVGISEPLRVCFDDHQGTAPNCDPGLAPTCTKNCVITADQKFSAGQIREHR